MINEKLKDLRMTRGVSLQKVADATKTSKTYIWRLEKGKTKNPTLDVLRNLAEFFDVSVAYLIGENDKMSNTNKNPLGKWVRRKGSWLLQFSITDALTILHSAMDHDFNYACSWHHNIAIIFQDAGASRAVSQEGASRVMKSCFNIDTHKCAK